MTSAWITRGREVLVLEKSLEQGVHCEMGRFPRRRCWQLCAAGVRPAASSQQCMMSRVAGRTEPAY